MTTTPSDVDPDDVSLSIEMRDGKLHAPVDELQGWDANPREVHETDIERLQRQLADLGQYKPLIVAVDSQVVDDGTVLGGNMRLEAITGLGWDDVWVSLVSPQTEDGLVEYALSDNDRVGHYDEEQVADMLDSTADLDVSKFKVDFYQPQDIAQNLASEMDPETLLEKVGAGADDDETGEPSAIDRSLENLGADSSTAMVQLIMAKGEKDDFIDQVQTLKLEYGVSTTTDVVQEAVEREFDKIADEYPAPPADD